MLHSKPSEIAICFTLAVSASHHSHEPDTVGPSSPLIPPTTTVKQHSRTPLLAPRPLRLHLPPLPNPLQYLLPILINLQLRNHHLARRDPQRHALPVRFFPRDPLDVDYVFEAVDAGYFSFAAFVRAAGYEDFVVFADGEGADLGGGMGC